MLVKTYKKGKIVLTSTRTGGQVTVQRSGGSGLGKRGIEIQVMNPRLSNLGAVGVALVQAVRAGA